MASRRVHGSGGMAATLPRAALVLLALAGACSVYDSTLLDAPRPPAQNAGSGDGVAGDVMQERAARCGDAIVAASEKCDTGVAPGTPGACPSACPPLAACAERALRGAGCQAECVAAPPACKDGDGCCSGNCTIDNDADCSSSCGDGEVQVAEGETCEADGSTPACPTDCDDADACTTDTLTGSAQNCNAECMSAPTTALVAGDDCCPEGANANTDADCMAECGNAVREPGEDCDGGPGCDASCVLTMTSTQEQCLALFPAPDACETCACVSCTQLVLDCHDSRGAPADMQCVDVVDCARDNDCTGTPCYCGAADLLACAILPAGPCVTPIQIAAAAFDPVNVLLRQNDPAFALGRANLLGMCSVMNCPSDCP